MIICTDGDNKILAETRERLCARGYATVGCASSTETRDVLHGNDDVEGLVTAYDLPDGGQLQSHIRLRNLR